MRLYLEVARRSYARISTYRSATVAGVFTNTVFGFLLAYVLRAVYTARNVVAADVVELSPVPGLAAPNFLCAKLIYKMLAYKFGPGMTRK